jgi:hypothetical protein
MSQKIYYKLLTCKNKQLSSWFMKNNQVDGGIRYRVNKWVKARRNHYKTLYVCTDMETVEIYMQKNFEGKPKLRSDEAVYTCHVKGIIHRLATKYPPGVRYVEQVKLLKRVRV